MSKFFQPKLVSCLEHYSWTQFSADLAAGITVGIVALPLAMAFGIASGVAPAAGIFTAIIAGFIISGLGGSRVQIGGPTGAFVVIIYGIVQKYGLADLAVCTMMAGCILILMGVSRMGTIIRYIPRPVTVGFTNGIAVLIFSTQIKDFFGLHLDPVPADFVEKMGALYQHVSSYNPIAFALAAVSAAVIFFWPKSLARRLPGSIVALVLATTATAYFHLPVETIGSRFGGIPQSLPPFHFPEVSWMHIHDLIRPATTIALLAAIESLLSAVVADGMIDGRHDSNQELMAQGMANIVCPLFGGIPATGAIARTATNIRNGGRTPVAGIIHAITLLVIILAAAPLAKFIPLATLSAVLMVVAFNMGEWREFLLIRRLPASDVLVLLTTFTLTVVFDLTLAVEVGMVLAAMLFIRRVADMTQVTLVNEESETEGEQHSVRGKEVPPGVLVFRVFGVLMFGAEDKLENLLLHSHQEPEVTILGMHKVLAMDSTALDALERLYEKIHRRGKHLILCGPHTQPLFLMEKAGFVDQIGLENFVGDMDDALVRARQILGQKAD